MENRHLKSDMPQLPLIYKSDHDSNNSFQKRRDILSVKGQDGVNLQQSLFWAQFWRFIAEVFKEVFILIKQEWDQLLKWKKKKGPGR